MSIKIAFLCHPYHKGGVTRWMADAAIYLSNSGHEVYFITVEPEKEFITGKERETMLKLLADEPNNIHIIKKKVGYEFEFGTPEYVTNTYRNLILKRLVKGIPIIVSDYHLIWEAASTVAEKYPMIGILHTDVYYYYDLAKKYAKQLSLIVGVSQCITDKVTELLPDVNRKIFLTIPYGINLSLFLPTEQEPSNVLNLIFIGRFDAAEKRAQDLVGISASLAQKNIEFQLNIIGNSPTSEKIFLEHFKNAGVERFVIFRGWLSKIEINKILPFSDVLLLTSDTEGLPIVMMEALASGCGFVGTRISGMADFESHPLTENCYAIFSLGNIEDAVNKIKKIGSVSKATRSAAARKFAEAEFNIQRCAEQYINAIDSADQPNLTKLNYSFSFIDLLYSRSLAFARNLKLTITNKRPK